MAIEYIGEKIFLEEIKNAGQVWVARGAHKNIYTTQFERAQCSLPVWSSNERVESFLKNARLIGPKYEPHAVSLDVFTKAWLSDKMMAIAELQLNPDGINRRVLAVYTEEFQASQGIS